MSVFQDKVVWITGAWGGNTSGTGRKTGQALASARFLRQNLS